MSEFSIAVIAGDGIGQEVTVEALKVLNAADTGSSFATTDFDLGANRYLSTGEVLPDSVLAEIAAHDVILLGAVGDPRVPPGVLERGLLLRLRFELDHYVNLRPVKLYQGVDSPLEGDPTIDMVVVREGTEGLYAGAGGSVHLGTPYEVATEESLNTAFGVRRVIEESFARAARRRKHVTLVHKTNVLTNAGGLWRRVFDDVAAKHPEITTDYQHVDAASMFFVTNPERFDVVVTDNLFGDILTDIGAAIAGGIGLAASGNINPTRTTPSMFEPVHGSAPDIAGEGKADPTAAILSVSMMLDHLGEPTAAEAVESAVQLDLARRGSKPRTTSQIGDDIVSALAG